MKKLARWNQFLNWSILLVTLTVTLFFTAVPANAISFPFLIASQQFPNTIVTLANQFLVSSDQLPEFLDRWKKIGQYMQQQQGFVSAELKKDILNSQEWTMSEQWHSLAEYQKAVSTPEFQALIQDFPGQATWFSRDLFPAH